MIKVDPDYFNMSYEDVIQKMGGFGFMQKYVVVIFILNFMTGGMIVYGLEFLETLPEY